MATPDLNKNGTPHLHGDMSTQTFRLDNGLIQEVQKISDASGIPRSVLYRDFVRFGLRKAANDGSIMQEIRQAIKRKSEPILIDKELLTFTGELSDMRKNLNQLGNNLAQDIKLRHIRNRQLEVEEDKYTNLRNERDREIDSLKSYYAKLIKEEETLSGLSPDGDSTDHINNIKRLNAELKKKSQEINARYPIKDFSAEKTALVTNNEHDEALREQIRNSISNIDSLMEKMKDVICKTVPKSAG